MSPLLPDDFDTKIQCEEFYLEDDLESDPTVFDDDDGDWDGADAEALASAGWGSDEDYGGYGDE
jgi:hypothetical protein